MAKKYVVKEESGCGCSSFIGLCIIAFVLIQYGIYIAAAIMAILVVAAVVFYKVYYPAIKANKAAEAEEAALAERERRIANEQRRREIEANEKELFNNDDDLEF